MTTHDHKWDGDVKLPDFLTTRFMSDLFRVSFDIYQNTHTKMYWAIADYVCDGLYLFDTLVIRTRLQFLDEAGIYETERKKTMRNYVKNGTFKKDLASLLPLDIFYLASGFTGKYSRVPNCCYVTLIYLSKICIP